MLSVLAACTRSQYRAAADKEAYCLVESRQTDPRWDLPTRAVEPKHHSRMYVGPDIDCAPKPKDDIAAAGYMAYPDCFDNTSYYSEIPTKPHAENPIWIDYLERDEENKINLTLPLSMDLALLHSRDFQTQFESVYLTALQLSGNRFEFDCQWFGGLGTGFAASGDDLGRQRLLTVSDRLGFGRSLPGGGQFATSVLNSLFWDFGTGGIDGGSAGIVTTFTQPLLRGAFRHVRLENLTQAERDLLYTVRDFARFRRTFYLDVTNSYLNLLTQVQAIRNTRTNVKNLRRSLDEYELYLDLGIVSPVAVDQVYQDYQSGRLSLLAVEQSLAESLDRFKFQLGLPPWVPFEVDESLLEPFELVDPELVQMQDEAQELYLEIVQFLPPEVAPKKFLEEGLQRYKKLREQIAEKLPNLEEELATWLQRIEQASSKEMTPDDQLDIQQQQSLADRIKNGLSELSEKLESRESDHERIQDAIDRYDVSRDDSNKVTLGEEKSVADPADSADSADDDTERSEIVAMKELQNAVSKGLREEIAELFVAQTQIRIFLLDIEPLSVQEQTAITYAHQNRLDLMNDKAGVMDAFRQVEVAADALESELNLTSSVALGSDPGVNNAFRLDSSANRYRVGVQFDGPLNRLNERNFYRASQIAYQRSSRDLVAQKDLIANDVRRVLRQLKLRRLNFQIARQQVVAATRQVDQAQIALRTSDSADSNLTLFLLQALNQLLASKNNLISEWFRYRVEKVRLFTTLELLYLDETGAWINEQEGLADLSQAMVIDPEYFPPAWTTDVATQNSESETDLDQPSESDTAPPVDDTLTAPSESSAVVLPSVPYAFGFDAK